MLDFIHQVGHRHFLSMENSLIAILSFCSLRCFCNSQKLTKQLLLVLTWIDVETLFLQNYWLNLSHQGPNLKPCTVVDFSNIDIINFWFCSMQWNSDGTKCQKLLLVLIYVGFQNYISSTFFAWFFHRRVSGRLFGSWKPSSLGGLFVCQNRNSRLHLSRNFD